MLPSKKLVYYSIQFTENGPFKILRSIGNATIGDAYRAANRLRTASRRVFEWIRKARLGFRYEVSDLLNLEETDSQAPFVVPNLRTRLVKNCAGMVLELVGASLSEPHTSVTSLQPTTYRKF